MTDTKRKSALSNFSISPEQSRRATVGSQLGGSAGAVTGTVIGAVAGRGKKNSTATGAFLGGAIGTSIGGASGTVAGLASNAPKVDKTIRTKIIKPKKVNVDIGKRNQNQGKTAIAGGAGVAAGTALAVRNTKKVKENAFAVKHFPTHAGDYSNTPNVRAAFNESIPFVERELRSAHRNRKLGVALVGTSGAVAVHNSLNKAFDESKHTRNAGKFAHKNNVIESAQSSSDRQRKLVTGGLIFGSVADAGALKAGYRESKSTEAAHPVKLMRSGAHRVGKIPGLIRRTETGLGRARYVAGKGSLPLQIGGVSAALAAAHLIHSDGKKEKAMSKAYPYDVDELFEKAQSPGFQSTIHPKWRAVGGGVAGNIGGSVVGAMTGSPTAAGAGAILGTAAGATMGYKSGKRDQKNELRNFNARTRRSTKKAVVTKSAVDELFEKAREGLPNPSRKRVAGTAAMTAGLGSATAGLGTLALSAHESPAPKAAAALGAATLGTGALTVHRSMKLRNQLNDRADHKEAKTGKRVRRSNYGIGW